MNNNLMAAAKAFKQLNTPNTNQTNNNTSQTSPPAFAYGPFNSRQSLPIIVNWQDVRNNMENLTKQIRQERKSLGISQRKLAQISNMSQGTITRAENKGWCSISAFMRIAIALNKQITLS